MLGIMTRKAKESLLQPRLDVAPWRWVQFVLHYYAWLGPVSADATLGAMSWVLRAWDIEVL